MIIIIIEIMLYKNLLYEISKFINQNNLILLYKINKNFIDLINNYIKTIQENNYYKFNIIKNEKSFILSSKNNYIITLLYIVNNKKYYVNFGFYGACEGGHINTVKLMIKIEIGINNWNWGLYLACRRGYMKIVKLMIENGATRCEYCNKSIIEHMKKNNIKK